MRPAPPLPPDSIQGFEDARGGAWENFSESERCQIILEAYDRARGRDAMLRISVAVGLTTREANELGSAPHSAPQSN
jgi:hypothetical protein